MAAVLAPPEASVRRSISIPGELYGKIDEVAANRRVSVNRAVLDLLRDAIEAYEQRRRSFMDLADRFQKSTDPAESEALKNELARMTFGG